jgi:CBS domain-containing membrane protein
MTENVIAVDIDGNLAEVRDLMDHHFIRHLPVVDADGSIVGLITERDLLRQSLEGFGDVPPSTRRHMLKQTSVETVMTRHLEVVTPTDDLIEVGRLMLDNKLGCMPVVEGDVLVGILTEADFIKLAVGD